MVITGRHGDYEVKYKQVGYAYAEVLVFTVKTTRINLVLFQIPRTTRTQVWSTRCGEVSLSYDKLEKMYPQPLRALFQRAVDEYENYVDAWNAEKDISIPADEVPRQRLLD